jgi:hypothetical protein
MPAGGRGRVGISMTAVALLSRLYCGTQVTIAGWGSPPTG